MDTNGHEFLRNESVLIRTPVMKLRAQPARIWSAVTCHRFCRFGDLSPKQGRVQRPGEVGRLTALDGDKSPAESADKSAHSKGVAAPPRCAFLRQLRFHSMFLGSPFSISRSQACVFAQKA